MDRKATAISGAALTAWLVLAVASVADAQATIDGAWQASVPVVSGGTAQLRFEFTSVGDELVGTLQVDDSPPVPIEDGRIRDGGEVVVFKYIPTNRRSQVLFIGKVLQDSIVGAFARVAGPFSSNVIQFTASRAEPRRER